MKFIFRLLIKGVVLGVVAYLAATLAGLRLIKKGQRPFDAEALALDGGKYVTNEQGRMIEYFVYGSQDKDAKVVVTMHGSGPEALSEVHLHEPACETLGVKGISISLPGYGYTDMKPGRQVKDWPKEDLEPVLTQEGVEKFMITGHSQGNPHAMAAAFYFGDRCEGIGMNAPLLPADVSKEIGLKGAIGSESLMSTETLRKPAMAWYFVLYHLGVVTFSPWLPMRALSKDRPKIDQDQMLVQVFRETLQRAVVRGSVGAAWETAGDVCYEWGFDPRLIETKNVVIWHAADDNWCPPEIGKWLADHFQAKEGVTVNYRADDQGFGHLTYCRGEFLEPETSMIYALIDGCQS